MARTPRALPEAWRTADRVKPDHEIRLADGEWVKVTRTQDVEGVRRQVRFVFDDGRDFYAARSQTIYSRYQPDNN